MTDSPCFPDSGFRGRSPRLQRRDRNGVAPFSLFFPPATSRRNTQVAQLSGEEAAAVMVTSPSARSTETAVRHTGFSKYPSHLLLRRTKSSEPRAPELGQSFQDHHARKRRPNPTVVLKQLLLYETCEGIVVLTIRPPSVEPAKCGRQSIEILARSRHLEFDLETRWDFRGDCPVPQTARQHFVKP